MVQRERKEAKKALERLAEAKEVHVFCCEAIFPAIGLGHHIVFGRWSFRHVWRGDKSF